MLRNDDDGRRRGIHDWLGIDLVIVEEVAVPEGHRNSYGSTEIVELMMPCESAAETRVEVSAEAVSKAARKPATLGLHTSGAQERCD